MQIDELPKLYQLFQSDNIELGIQLIKSLGYKLEDVLHALYDKYNSTYRGGDLNWFVLNTDDPYKRDAICIWFHEGQDRPYCLFGGVLDHRADDTDELTVEPCIKRLANILKQHYDK